MFVSGTKVSKAFSNLLNYIDKLLHTKKEQLYQWVKRYVEPSSSVERGEIF